MSLDLANTNNLDDVFANYLDKEDFLLFPLQYPTGARLEDEFGSSAKYLPANAFNYTPNGWVLKDEYSSFDSDSFSQITDDDVVNFIDELASFEGEDFSNFRILGIGKLSDKQKQRREKIKKGFHVLIDPDATPGLTDFVLVGDHLELWNGQAGSRGVVVLAGEDV